MRERKHIPYQVNLARVIDHDPTDYSGMVDIVFLTLPVEVWLNNLSEEDFHEGQIYSREVISAKWKYEHITSTSCGYSLDEAMTRLVAIFQIRVDRFNYDYAPKKYWVIHFEHRKDYNGLQYDIVNRGFVYDIELTGAKSVSEFFVRDSQNEEKIRNKFANGK